MAGDERRAEIEAVARELKHNDECGPGPVSEEEYRADAKEIIAALDRVRDARGDDETGLRDLATQAMLDALAWMDPQTGRKFTQESSYLRLKAALSARSPQEASDDPAMGLGAHSCCDRLADVASVEAVAQGEDHDEAAQGGRWIQPEAFCEQPRCQAKNDGHCHVPENCGHFQPKERREAARSPQGEDHDG